MKEDIIINLFYIIKKINRFASLKNNLFFFMCRMNVFDRTSFGQN